MILIDPRARRPNPWRQVFGCMVTLLMTGFGVAMAGDMVRPVLGNGRRERSTRGVGRADF